ncbi:MAG: hypothetical protein E7063_05310 [Spirochaetaceae bacterium]|nr:hypothetical protein [Spirochaetaceae bacterium]
MEENATSSRNVWNQLDKKAKTEQSRIHQLQVEAEKVRLVCKKGALQIKMTTTRSEKRKGFLKLI